MFVLTVRFSIAPDHYRQFMAHMVSNARNSLALEPGCLRFDVCEDPARRGEVFLYEIYRDEAAFEQHKREAHFLQFDRDVASCVLEKSVKSYSLMDLS
jgi:(4S)-4-hydroxy-5-phosphonooxypentane-2,3-dione isomerase